MCNSNNNICNGNSDIIFGYNGRDGVVTDDSGLLYMRARYYSPEMHRFINADIVPGSISNAITLNRYAYANGNPVSNSDPFGLSAQEDRGGPITTVIQDVVETTSFIYKQGTGVKAFCDAKNLISNGVKVKNKNDYLIIKGKSDALNDIGINQRRIRADNLDKYPKIKNLADPGTVFKNNIINSFDAPGIILDVASIGLDTYTEVQKYNSKEDKLIVGAYTAGTGIITSVASTVAQAGTVAAVTKISTGIGTAISPGLGTIIGLCVGFLAGLVADSIFDHIGDTLIKDIVENN